MNKTLLNIKKAIATITLLLVFPILFSGCNSYLDKYVDPETGKLNAFQTIGDANFFQVRAFIKYPFT